jgi:hypothetical protein
MTLSLYLLSTLVIIVIAGIAVFGQRQREKNLAKTWKPVDLLALSRLLNQEDDRFLAANVSKFILLRLRVERALAAGKYLTRLRVNSHYAVAIAKLNATSEENLLAAATTLRLEVAKLQWKVWAGVLAPINADVQKLNSLARLFSDNKRLRAVSTI